MKNDNFSAIRLILAKSDLYRFSSLAFAMPEEGSVESLNYLAGEIAESVGIIGAELNDEYRSFAKSISAADVETLKEEHSELFLTRMQCSPNEISYEKNRFKGPAVLGDISGFYKAFGFTLSDKAGVTHDNIAVELEFLCFLELKMAYALENGLEQQLHICIEAKKKFLDEHLGTWMKPFTDNLQKVATSDFYRMLSIFLFKFISCELNYYKIKVNTADMDYKPQEFDEPISCPAAPERENIHESSPLA